MGSTTRVAPPHVDARNLRLDFENWLRVAVRDTVFLSSCLLLTGFRPYPSVFRAATHITTPCVHPTDHDIRQRQLPELVLEPREARQARGATDTAISS